MEQILKRVNVSALRDDLAKALRKVEHGGFCYVVHRHDRPVAALVSMEVIRKYWAVEDANRGGKSDEVEATPEAETKPERIGYARRLWRRRKRRADKRVALGEEESKSDRWAYRHMRGMDDGV